MKAQPRMQHVIALFLLISLLTLPALAGAAGPGNAGPGNADAKKVTVRWSKAPALASIDRGEALRTTLATPSEERPEARALEASGINGQLLNHPSDSLHVVWVRSAGDQLGHVNSCNAATDVHDLLIQAPLMTAMPLAASANAWPEK